MESEGSSPFEPHPATGQDYLCSCVRLHIPSTVFPSGFPTNSLHA